MGSPRTRLGMALAGCTCFAWLSPRSVPAQASGLTVAAHAGLAFPRIALGADSVYQGEVEIAWQAGLAVPVGPRIAVGVGGGLFRESALSGDCPLKCSPSPELMTISAIGRYGIGGQANRPNVLVTAGAGLYLVRASYGAARSDEWGFHGGLEIPIVRLGTYNWFALHLRHDVVLGTPGSALRVLSVSLGLRHWGLGAGGARSTTPRSQGLT